MPAARALDIDITYVCSEATAQLLHLPDCSALIYAWRAGPIGIAAMAWIGC